MTLRSTIEDRCDYPDGWVLRREKIGAAVVWHTFREQADGMTVAGSRIEHPTRRAALARLTALGVM